MIVYKTIFTLFCVIYFGKIYSIELPNENSNNSETAQIDTLEKINTSFNEFSPSISPDGKFMLFNSKRGSDKYQDIYISKFKNGIWSKPEKFEILNSPYDDETPFISRDNNIIVFSSNRDGSKELPLNNGKKLVSFDLYWSKKANGQWSSPEPVPGKIITPHHERAPSLSRDNSILYFSRWESGKIDNASIMYSKLKQGIFENALPMPKQINSHSKEVALIPDQNDDGFYFSSMRDNGYGGWDIYYISYHNGQFGIPVNLGEKINSEYNEAFFSILNGRIYFCSDRSDGGKDYDINVRFLPGERHLVFHIHNPENNPIETESDIHQLFSDKVSRIKKYNSGPDGIIKLLIENNLESINLFIEKKGFLPFYKKIEQYEFLNNEIDITLIPINENTSFSIEAIYFDYKKALIKKESHIYLDRLSAYLLTNPDLILKIIGHTDLHGSEEYNLDLSKKRAMAVKEYLVSKGVQQGRLQSFGRGKSNPVINEISEYADRLNRRTEFKINYKH